jgi:hypothetical protein
MINSKNANNSTFSSAPHTRKSGEKPSVETAKALRTWAEAGKPLGDAADAERCLEKSALRKRNGPKRSISFKRKPFAPYLDRMPQGTDLESLFLEFLKERFGPIREPTE